MGAALCDSNGCKTGYYLTSTGNLCGPCSSNCRVCSVGNACDTCNTGYFKSGTTCTACYSTDKCTCVTAATLLDCTPIDGWGKYFVGTTLSNTNSAITTIAACVANCALCFGSAATDCLAALPKFYLDPTTGIVACPAGCDVCIGSTPDKCT